MHVNLHRVCTHARMHARTHTDGRMYARTHAHPHTGKEARPQACGARTHTHRDEGARQQEQATAVT